LVELIPANGYGLVMWRYLKIVNPVTAAKFINKSSLLIPLLGVVRRLELKPNSEKADELPSASHDHKP
jgi:hypothetical protein